MAGDELGRLVSRLLFSGSREAIECANSAFEMYRLLSELSGRDMRDALKRMLEQCASNTGG